MKIDEIDIVDIQRISKDAKCLIFKIDYSNKISYSALEQLSDELGEMARKLNVPIYIMNSMHTLEESNEEISKILRTGGRVVTEETNPL